jgi:hypothetical protein
MRLAWAAQQLLAICWITMLVSSTLGRTKTRGTALCVAAYYGHLDVVETILQRNPDTTMKNKWGETPIDCAIAGHKKYNNPTTQEKFYPMLKRARDFQERGRVTHVPDKRLRLGTPETAKTHPAWKPTNWDAIIARLGGRPSNP